MDDRTKSALVAKVGDQQQVIDMLTLALRDVLDPLGHLRRYAESQDRKLGGQAYAVAHNLGFVQKIAREALDRIHPPPAGAEPSWENQTGTLT